MAEMADESPPWVRGVTRTPLASSNWLNLADLFNSMPNPHTAIFEGPTPRVIAFGIDTLWLHWKAPLASDVVAMLLQKQELARVPGMRAGDVTVDFGGQTFVVKSHGSASTGATILLMNEQFAVKLTPVPLPKMPTVQIEIRSVWLWQRGADQAVADAQKIVTDLVPDGVYLHPATMEPHVTRLDLCADFQGWDPRGNELLPSKTATAFAGERDDPSGAGLRCEASRGQLHVQHSRAPLRHTGFSYGSKSSPMSAGIYDKRAEIEDASQKDWFEQVWQGSPEYDKTALVWRLEYRLKREKLTTFSLVEPSGKVLRVETWAQTKRALPDIWKYCTGRWLVLRAPRTTKTRRVISPRWMPFYTLDHELLHVGRETVLRKRHLRGMDVDFNVMKGYAARIQARVQHLNGGQVVPLEPLMLWLVPIFLAADEAAANRGRPTMADKRDELRAEWSLLPETSSGALTELPEFDEARSAYWKAAGRIAYDAKPATVHELAARMDRVGWASPEEEEAKKKVKPWLVEEKKLDDLAAQWFAQVVATA